MMGDDQLAINEEQWSHLVSPHVSVGSKRNYYCPEVISV